MNSWCHKEGCNSVGGKPGGKVEADKSFEEHSRTSRMYKIRHMKSDMKRMYRQDCRKSEW